jgi:hypothetical protein
MREILIHGSGTPALIDDVDHELVASRKWYLKPNGYAMARFRSEAGAVAYRTMHRVIMNAQPGTQIEHANLNRLDNRRGNLRIATQTQNLANTVAREHTSIFKGVHRHRDGVRWNASIVHGHTISLGTYNDEIVAAFAYDRAAREHFGEFARLNFPDNSAVRDRLRRAGAA